MGSIFRLEIASLTLATLLLTSGCSIGLGALNADSPTNDNAADVTDDNPAPSSPPSTGSTDTQTSDPLIGNTPAPTNPTPGGGTIASNGGGGDGTGVMDIPPNMSIPCHTSDQQTQLIVMAGVVIKIDSGMKQTRYFPSLFDFPHRDDPNFYYGRYADENVSSDHLVLRIAKDNAVLSNAVIRHLDGSGTPFQLSCGVPAGYAP